MMPHIATTTEHPSYHELNILLLHLPDKNFLHHPLMKHLHVLEVDRIALIRNQYTLRTSL